MVDGLWSGAAAPGLERAVGLGTSRSQAWRSSPVGSASCSTRWRRRPPSARLWERIDAFAPDTAIVLKPDHVRDVDLFVRWYGVRALGPVLFWRDDIPKTELEQIRPGDELPAGWRRSTTAAG